MLTVPLLQVLRWWLTAGIARSVTCVSFVSISTVSLKKRVSVVSDVPVVPDVPSPLPIDLDPRRRIIAASFGLLDEVCLKDEFNCRAHVV